MNPTPRFRLLEIEQLSSRIVFAVQEFLVLESQATDLKPSTFNDGSATPQMYRQVSWVEGKDIKTIGIHPQASELLTRTTSLELPAGAVDILVQGALDSDSALGTAEFDGGLTELVLWINPTLPILLGDEIPLIAYQWPDQSIDVAFTSGKVVRFDQDGAQVNEILFDEGKYTFGSAGPEGIALFGPGNDVPVAARIDDQFSFQEVQLAMPTGATFVEPIGLMLFDGEVVFAGSSTGPADEDRLVKWDLQGEVTDQSTTTGIFSLKASGQAEIVDTGQGFALIVYDNSLADMLGIQAGIPALWNELEILNGRGFATATLTDVLSEQNGEIFFGVIGADSNNNEIHGVISASLNLFPSPWMNQILAEDVGGSTGSPDGIVTPTDALLIIIELNTEGSRFLTSADLALESRIDPSGNGAISPTDALLVINLLNDRSGEGESNDDITADTINQLLPELIDEIRKKSRFWA